MIRLYFYPSTASMAPHLVLHELGVPHELVRIDKEGGELESASYRALNPNGLIPVLVDGDLVLYESAAICLHLADRFPEGDLFPPVGTAGRAHGYKWLMWLTNTLQATQIVYFYPERWAENTAAVAEVRLAAARKIDRLVDQLDAEFARHGEPWLLGTSYSVVDAYAFMLCRWTRNMPHPARARSHLGPWLARVLARPATARMFAAEGLTEPWY
jgi:glutathione S-transferase